jgi:outer membrane lipoprotein SlyB
MHREVQASEEDSSPGAHGRARANRNRNEDMSTNQNLKNRKTTSGASDRASDKQSKAKALDLSVPQILGGALAAMTAAALGAQLSVAGTLVGAALASIIAAVAGSLYTASIRRTRDKVKTVFWTAQPNEVDEPTVIDIVADKEGHIAGQRSHLVEPESSREPSPPRRPKLKWKRVVVAAFAIFGIAAVALTTFELVTGHALSGGEGTTIQQVSEGRANKEPATKKEKTPSEKPTSKATAEATAEATEKASESPTPEPRATASSEPKETTTAPTPEAQATTEANATPSGNG